MPKTPQDILHDHYCSVDVLKDVHSRDGKPGSELDRIIEAMQAYSSQQNTALMEENERLREALEAIKDGLLVNYKKDNKWYNLAYNATKPKL